MKAEYDFSGYYANQYDKAMYDPRSFGTRIMNRSHIMAEKPFSPESSFPKVLEVGAGTGHHFTFVQHQFDHYLMTEYNALAVEKLKNSIQTPKIEIQQADAANLPFADSSFNRLIACHILEHIHHPEKALREWYRVIADGGVISIVLPTDPGCLWRLTRVLFARRKAKMNALMHYDYVMALEHVNPINNLIALIRYYFEDIVESWYPTSIPSMDINLYYSVQIHISK